METIRNLTPEQKNLVLKLVLVGTTASWILLVWKLNDEYVKERARTFDAIELIRILLKHADLEAADRDFGEYLKFKNIMKDFE